MSILDQEISKEDFDKLSGLHIKKKDYHDFLKQIYKPLKFDYSTICEIKENAIYIDSPGAEPEGIYIGCISHQNSKLYALLRLMPNLTEDFNVLTPSLFSSYEDVITFYKDGDGEFHEH